jgi:hypothetical protein
MWRSFDRYVGPCERPASGGVGHPADNRVLLHRFTRWPHHPDNGRITSGRDMKIEAGAIECPQQCLGRGDPAGVERYAMTLWQYVPTVGKPQLTESCDLLERSR